MSYNPNIPQVTDNTVQSAPQIRANFQQINVAWSENHTEFTGTNPQGKHDVLTMRPQTGDPVTTATQTALYNKLVTAIPELFFAPNSAQTPIQMTYPSIIDSGGTQYSFVAGPFIVYGGYKLNVTNGQVVTLTPGSQLIYVDLTMHSFTGVPINTLAVPTSVVGTSFTISFIPPASGTVGIYYLAIGLP